MSIGQGHVNVTPISLAVMMMTVANGGTRYTPHVVKAVDDGKGWQPVPPPPPQSTVKMKQSTDRCAARRAVDGRQRRRHRRPGADSGYNVAGKTGTAQVISLEGAKAAKGKMDVRDHGWFVFFAPHDKPEIAGVIFAEHSEHGYLGAPIAKYAMETYFAKKEGRPLPALPPKAGAGAGAGHRGCRQQPARRRPPRQIRLQIAMFERRLFFHVDWLLLAAILVIAGIGVAMIYSTTYVHLPEPRHPGRSSTPSSTPSASGWSRSSCAWRSTIASSPRLAHPLRRPDGAAHLRPLPGLDAVQRHALDHVGPFNLQPSEFGRVTVALMLAMFFGENRRGARNPGDL